ncbi:hypothetical protein K1T71_014868 [Dendrolimus kikuchii]|nr:hypothetical protein K1T71_014868 [Dendrolimus kikuchii]
MVRTYLRKFTNLRNGKNHSPYLSYSNEDLQEAIEAIQNGSLRLKDAAEKYNIPKSTLSRKSRNLNCTQQKAGHPTLFSKDEEMVFLEYIKILSAWGFPLDSTDLRVFAQNYLNKIGKTLYSLKDNMPGVDWARNFINRHKSEISNLTPDCIINYDETNLTDDPGNKKYLFKRGCKYPERVINNTKTSISLMFTGTADGQLLPIYVVYKADHLWDQWLEGGPTGTRYNRSKSGWFDSTCFEDWFNTIIVPYAKTKIGRKLIIGDNLSSHFSQSVLRTCQKLNIIFVCLPPKTTHLLQPLDVAFYAPLKKYWRDVLTQWKKTDGFKHKTLAKNSFPMLLCKLHNKLTEKGSGSSNIIAGFSKSGLYPVNSERPKSRLPQTNSISEEIIQNAAFTAVKEILQEIRNPPTTLEQPKRKKKCNVPPGKSITAEDLGLKQTQPIESQQNKKKSTVKSQQNKRKYKKSTLISAQRNRSYNIDSDVIRDIAREKEYNFSQPIAGPSGLCKMKTQTTHNKENMKRGSESDSTFVSSQDEFLDNQSTLIQKNKENTLQPISSFISIKGKVKCKKSKQYTDGSETSKRQAANTSAKFIKKNISRKSSGSTTSVSDSMSMHSDLDLLDVDFGEHSSDVHNYNYCVTEIKNNFDDKNQTTKNDNEPVNSFPLFFFDNESGADEEIVVGEDFNATLISTDEKVIDIANNIVENTENNIRVEKKITIIKDENIKNVLQKKKVIFKNLKPISLNHPINTRKTKNYYNNSQEILKVLIDSD